MPNTISYNFDKISVLLEAAYVRAFKAYCVIPKWPERLHVAPERISDIHGGSVSTFKHDDTKWQIRVKHYRKLLPALGTDKIRNVMDMNTVYGGFAAAVIEDPLWVMNVVSSYTANKLAVVFDRGLIGTYRDWCEAFSTYPRTYDLLHLDGLKFCINGQYRLCLYAFCYHFCQNYWVFHLVNFQTILEMVQIYFLNIGTLSSGCDGAPLLPVLFVLVNMGFNISLLHLLKMSTALVSSLASTFSVPISVYIFTLPLPYLGVASSLPTGFVAGAIILVMGLLIYAWTPTVSHASACSASRS